MIEPGQKPLLATLNALPQKSKEKERTMSKPKNTKACFAKP